MFALLKKRQRTDHAELIWEIIEKAEKLAVHSEVTVLSGIDRGGRSECEAAVLRSIVEDLRPLLAELKANEGALIPSEGLGPLLNMWKDLHMRLDLVERTQKAARAHLGIRDG